MSRGWMSICALVLTLSEYFRRRAKKPSLASLGVSDHTERETQLPAHLPVREPGATQNHEK